MKNSSIPVASTHQSVVHDSHDHKHPSSAPQRRGLSQYNEVSSRRGSLRSRIDLPAGSEVRGSNEKACHTAADNVINDALVNDGFIFNAILSEASETGSHHATEHVSPESFALFTAQNEPMVEIASSLADVLGPELLAENFAEFSVDILLPKFGRVRVRSRKQASSRHLQLTAEKESTHFLLKQYANECKERLSNDLEENVSLTIQKSEFDLL